MTDKVGLDEAQLQKIIATVGSLEDHSPYWKHFLIASVPIFLASMLGLLTAWLLDAYKNRREETKTVRERREKELSLLSVVNTAIGFNISTLIHTAVQQVLPHYKQSNAALFAVEALHGERSRLQAFVDQLHIEFGATIKRCPEPYLEEINLSRDLPFLIAKDPSLIMTSGWIITYSRNLKSILIDRNKYIDEATSTKDGLDLTMVEQQVATQSKISDVEVVNIYQLFLLLHEASEKITKIVSSDYKDVNAPKLRIAPPEVYGSLMIELEQIMRTIAPDWLRPQPTTEGASPTAMV